MTEHQALEADIKNAQHELRRSMVFEHFYSKEEAYPTQVTIKQRSDQLWEAMGPRDYRHLGAIAYLEGDVPNAKEEVVLFAVYYDSSYSVPWVSHDNRWDPTEDGQDDGKNYFETRQQAFGHMMDSLLKPTEIKE